MISAAIDKYHGENVARLVKIEERIIGIDGNGTGREGALQRQDKVLKRIETEVTKLVTASTSWNKRDLLHAAKWVLATIISISAVAVAYMDYHAKYHAGDPLLSEHPTTASYTTSDSR